MVRKNYRKNLDPKSVNRIFSAFINRPMSEIAQIQSAHALKDYNMLNKLSGRNYDLTKPEQKNFKKIEEYNNAIKTYKSKLNSLLGYGRIANQYVYRTTNIDKRTVDVVKKQFNITLNRDFNRNVKILGNSLNYQISKTTITEEFKRQKKGTKKLNVRLKSKYFDGINKYIKLFLRNAEGIFKGYRVFLEITTNKGLIHVSSFKFAITDIDRYDKLILKFRKMVKDNLLYESKDLATRAGRSKLNNKAELYQVKNIIVEVYR